MAMKDSRDVSMDRRIYVGGNPIDISDEYPNPAEKRGPIYTFGLIKPHAYNKKGQILLVIEELSEHHRKPLYVILEKEYRMSTEMAEQHYAEHRQKPFFTQLIQMITEGPVLVLILSGYDAIAAFRQVVGTTDPRAAGQHTLRHRFGEFQLGMERFGDEKYGVMFNAVHASDSLGSFVRETELIFTREELELLGEHFWKRFDVYKEWAMQTGRGPAKR